MNNYNAIPLELRPLTNNDGGGVYMILNVLNGKFYIGSTFNFWQRWKKHENDLNLKKHQNRHLQFAWNKYGSESFQFIVLEKANKVNIVLIEQLWINASDCCNTKIGYNLSPSAYSVFGIKRSEETKLKMKAASLNRSPPSIETRTKMSLSAKLKLFSDTHRMNMGKSQFGRKHPAETKLKMSLSARKPKSNQHKINNGLAKRDFAKWPHKKGNRCNCTECKLKINDNARVQYTKRTLKNVS